MCGSLKIVLFRTYSESDRLHPQRISGGEPILRMKDTLSWVRKEIKNTLGTMRTYLSLRRKNSRSEKKLRT